MKLTLLGTGTPNPLANRAGSSYYLEAGDARILIDCGPGSANRLIEAGIRPTEITHLLLTHLHYDHCVDFACIHSWRWDQGAGETPPLKLIGPEGTKTFYESLFGENGAFRPDIQARTEHPLSHAVYESRGGQLPRKPPEVELTEVHSGNEINLGSCILTVAQGIHAEPILTCLAYRLQAGEESICFTGDTGPNRAIPQLAQGVHTLVHMCHFQNSDQVDPRLAKTCSGHLDAARNAGKAGVERLILIHLTPSMQDSEKQEKMRAEAAEIFSGEIVFGEDLMRLAISER